MVPPCQCFEADHPTGPSVCDRLVVKDHLAELHRPAKLGALQGVARVAIPERAVGVEPGHQPEQEEHGRLVDLLDSTRVALRERPHEQHSGGTLAPRRPPRTPYITARSVIGTTANSMMPGSATAKRKIEMPMSMPTAAALNSTDRDIRTLTII